MKAFYDNKPAVLGAVGNGSYLYRWGIKEAAHAQDGKNAGDVNPQQWECEEATVWPPLTAGRLAAAALRESYSQEEQAALASRYASYQQGITSDGSAVEEYAAYLAAAAEAERSASEALGGMPHAATAAALPPRFSDMVRVLSLAVNGMGLDDAQALSSASVFPRWEDCAGKELPEGFRLLDGGRLYKVLQQHTAQADWKPSATPALYGLVAAAHAGTLEDPIPYERMMVLEQGKYYTQGGSVYLCVTGSVAGYDADLTDGSLAALLQKIG